VLAAATLSFVVVATLATVITTTDTYWLPYTVRIPH
jgi:hypothetical protein